MVSSKERLRLERMFDSMKQRMDRQKASLDRMAASHIELTAALFEIAESDLIESGMRARARRALESVAAQSAATLVEQGESDESGDPTPGEENGND